MKDQLIQIQEQRGWTDAEMASALGVARSAWTMVRSGARPLTERMQVKAAQAFPEIGREWITSLTVTPQEGA